MLQEGGGGEAELLLDQPQVVQEKNGENNKNSSLALAGDSGRAVHLCSPEGPQGRLYGGVAGRRVQTEAQVKSPAEGGRLAGRPRCGLGLFSVRIKVWT